MSQTFVAFFIQTNSKSHQTFIQTLTDDDTSFLNHLCGQNQVRPRPPRTPTRDYWYPASLLAVTNVHAKRQGRLPGQPLACVILTRPARAAGGPPGLRPRLAAGYYVTSDKSSEPESGRWSLVRGTVGHGASVGT